MHVIFLRRKLFSPPQSDMTRNIPYSTEEFPYGDRLPVDMGTWNRRFRFNPPGAAGMLSTRIQPRLQGVCRVWRTWEIIWPQSHVVLNGMDGWMKNGIRDGKVRDPICEYDEHEVQPDARSISLSLNYRSELLPIEVRQHRSVAYDVPGGRMI